MNDACACGSGRLYAQCCAPIIAGETAPATAEALMRSRYTAFTVGAIDHLYETLAGRQRGDFDREAAESWSREAEWRGLDILAVEAGGATDESGSVEFVARYSQKGVEQRHHERARFVREGGLWRYDDGEDLSRPIPVHVAPKPGRNEPCPCGSGLKYKKCCGS